ncbi:MAG: hypothetical protein BJ554DRAFT_4601, partial [Olpidium bornovanus]
MANERNEETTTTGNGSPFHNKTLPGSAPIQVAQVRSYRFHRFTIQVPRGASFSTPRASQASTAPDRIPQLRACGRGTAESSHPGPPMPGSSVRCFPGTLSMTGERIKGKESTRRKSNAEGAVHDRADVARHRCGVDTSYSAMFAAFVPAGASGELGKRHVATSLAEAAAAALRRRVRRFGGGGRAVSNRCNVQLVVTSICSRSAGFWKSQGHLGLGTAPGFRITNAADREQNGNAEGNAAGRRGVARPAQLRIARRPVAQSPAVMAATLSPPSHGVFFPQEPPLPSIPSTDAARRHSQTGAYGDHQFGPTASRATGTHGLPALHHLTGAGGADVSLQLDELNFAGKLSNVEAQRIMSVLQDVQRKVILVGMLPDTMDRRVSSVFGQEVTMMLQ